MCTLYDRIQNLCKSKGVSASRMCLDLGLSKSTISDIKSGRKKGVSTATAQKMAGYFGISVGTLLGEEQEENPTTASGDEVKKSVSGYELLNEDNKAIIDQMIEKLIKAQSAE